MPIRKLFIRRLPRGDRMVRGKNKHKEGIVTPTLKTRKLGAVNKKR